MLVRGEDPYGHYHVDTGATGEFEPEAVAAWEEMVRRQKETQGTA